MPLVTSTAAAFCLLSASPAAPRVATVHSARCCATPPPRHRRARSVRVKRSCTSQQPDWEWQGRQSPPQSEPITWRALFSVEDNVIKMIETLWSRSMAKNSLFKRVTALGARVLRSVGEALERTLYPDAEKELVVQYGLTEPSPTDKTYVDPLHDWQTSNVTYYSDSVGRRVYLQLDGANGVLAALDFRDQFDDAEGDDADLSTDASAPAVTGEKHAHNDSSPPSSVQVLHDDDDNAGRDGAAPP